MVSDVNNLICELEKNLQMFHASLAQLNPAIIKLKLTHRFKRDKARRTFICMASFLRISVADQLCA